MAEAGRKQARPGAVYLAGRTARRQELVNAAATLRTEGIEVVSSWLDDPKAGSARSDGDAAGAACRNLRDVKRCDVLVAVTEGEGSVGKGGRHVELGIALALGKRVLLVGPPEHVFHRMVAVERHTNLNAAIEALKQDG
jgi:nucleoside 2-deoxyribosyltransferase